MNKQLSKKFLIVLLLTIIFFATIIVTQAQGLCEYLPRWLCWLLAFLSELLGLFGV